jgi:hypothetical protein
MTRCTLCGIPLHTQGQTPYCSERCLLWDTLGIPHLQRDALLAEIVANQRRSQAPEHWQPAPAYPRLADYAVFRAAQHTLTYAAATLHTHGQLDRQ